MFWKGRELENLGDMLDYGIDECYSPEEAHEFLRLYTLENPHAAENIGYLAGYCSEEKAKRIFDWFEVKHPIFGTEWPSPEEAFKMGQDMMKNRLEEKVSKYNITDKFDL